MNMPYYLLWWVIKNRTFYDPRNRSIKATVALDKLRCWCQTQPNCLTIGFAWLAIILRSWLINVTGKTLQPMPILTIIRIVSKLLVDMATFKANWWAAKRASTMSRVKVLDLLNRAGKLLNWFKSTALCKLKGWSGAATNCIWSCQITFCCI